MLLSPAAAGVQRKIVFTSSVAAFVNLTGYSTYMASKAAVRGLADTLRQEFLMYDIAVHCVFPATIFSPGFAVEQTIKPEITKVLEGADEGQTCDQVAVASMRGLDKGYAMINTELPGNLLRCAMKGPSPKNGPLDFVFSFVSSLVLPFFLFDWEQKVKKHGEHHRRDLVAKGLMVEK
jgi:3-dehydrosphinganine reductase